MAQQAMHDIIERRGPHLGVGSFSCRSAIDRRLSPQGVLRGWKRAANATPFPRLTRMKRAA